MNETYHSIELSLVLSYAGKVSLFNIFTKKKDLQKIDSDILADLWQFSQHCKLITNA